MEDTLRKDRDTRETRVLEMLSVIWDEVRELSNGIYLLEADKKVQLAINPKNNNKLIELGDDWHAQTTDNIIYVVSQLGTVIINAETQEFVEYPGSRYIQYMNMENEIVFTQRGYAGVDTLIILNKTTLKEEKKIKAVMYSKDDATGTLIYKQWNKGKTSGIEYKQVGKNEQLRYFTVNI